METNQTTTQQGVTNNKMMSCKTCGTPIAKSAKKCPSCGAKNKKVKMNKFIAFVAVVLVAVIAISIANIPRNIGIGSVVETGHLRVVLKNVQFENTNYVIANKRSNDFLSPIDKDDLELNDYFIRSNDSDMAAVAITVTVENIGKNDVSFGTNRFELDYNDGNRYYAKRCFAVAESGEWTEFDKIELEKVTSGVVEVRLLAWVPSAVYESSESFVLRFLGAEYKIR